MAKRGDSGLSMVLGVAKPQGMSSHDVVSQVRRIFGERRVGHAGTLDPFASGVLPIFVGPATRLNKYISSDDKAYVAEISFGTSTTTDDRCGDVLRIGAIAPSLLDRSHAEEVLASFLGQSMQMPPAFSAIKVNGRKACDEARKGNIIQLEPRSITVNSARLLDIRNDHDSVLWKVGFNVSKGTYIRALARDIGVRTGVPAHLSELERTSVGCLGIEDCTPLDILPEVRFGAMVDPVLMLGMKVAFADDDLASAVMNGRSVPVDRARICECHASDSDGTCSCTSTFVTVSEGLHDDEPTALICQNKLAAICRYDARNGMLKPDCVFQIGVSRGQDIQA